jgi:hypothetical protein
MTDKRIKSRPRLVMDEVEYVIPEDKAKDILKNAFQNGCLLWVEGKSWGNRKKLKDNLLEDMLKKANIPGTAKDGAVRAVQSLLESKKIDEINSWINKAHNWARSNSMQWLTDSVHFIHKEKVNPGDEFLKNCEEEVKKLAREFADEEYELAKAEFKEKYPKLYDEKNYPYKEDLIRRFRLRHGFQIISLPDAQGEISVLSKDQLMNESRKQLEMMKEMVEENVQAVRGMFVEMIKHLRDVLKDGKKFQNTTVEKPKKFLEEFSKINLFGDKPFEKLAETCKGLLDGVYAEDLKDDDEYRGILKESLDSVIKALDTLPKIKLARDIELDF